MISLQHPRSALPALALAAVAFVATNAPPAMAHQLVILPAPTYTVEGKDNRWKPLAFLEGQNFSTTDDFVGYLDASGFDSLRAFMDDDSLYSVNASADFRCGFTDPDAAPQPIPDGIMRSTGYTHDGPCEVWLDDTRVLQHDNCHEVISGKTYDLDYSACNGSCTLYWYWLGVRYLKQVYSWQVYKACVPISDGSAAASSEDSASGEMEETAAPSVGSSSSSSDAASVGGEADETSPSSSGGDDSVGGEADEEPASSADAETSAAGSSATETPSPSTAEPEESDETSSGTTPSKCRAKSA